MRSTGARGRRGDRRWRWRAALLALPLLQTGACVQLTQRAVITGFFQGSTPFLIEAFDDQIRDHFGAPGP
jgi:hypothetical protein